MRVPNNSKFACQKGQIELYFKFKAKNLSKKYIFRNPLDETANNTSLHIACNMRDANYSRDEILKLTGVDILTV